MPKSNNKAKGLNVIALILMVMTFFLVIGFSIGAMSTINLNLSGRSINVVKANQIAEAAVAQFIYHVSEKTLVANESIYLDNLSFPPLNLQDDYDGTPDKSILKQTDGYLGDDWKCIVDFKNMSNPYHSTDNSNHMNSAKGARGLVPPFTIDLIITVEIGTFVRHYQVWIARKWNYAIYVREGPVHILSNINKIPSRIEGNIYSGFNPLPVPENGYPVELVAAEIYPPTDLKEDYLLIENRIPPDILYPASITVGGKMRRIEIIKRPSPTVTHITIYPLCTNNSLIGRGVFSYPRSTNSPSPDIYIYPNNNQDDIKESIFSEKIVHPFSRLNLIDDKKVSKIHLINESVYPGVVIKKEGVQRDKDIGGGVISPSTVIKRLRDVSPSLYGAYKDLYGEYEDNYRKYCSEENLKTVFFLKKTLRTIPSPTPSDWDWSEGAKFVVRDDDGRYYPLVDKCVRVACTFTPTPVRSTERPDGILEEEYAYSIIKEVYQIDDTANDFIIDNSMVIANRDVELENTDFSGDNSMLQVNGNLLMRSGQISAGENIGAVIYCRNFYCDSWGIFNGVILVDGCMKFGGVDNPDKTLIVNGGILINGVQPSPSEQYIFDSNGLVLCGFNVVYNPAYMRFLNRFGPLRVACWRVLD